MKQFSALEQINLLVVLLLVALPALTLLLIGLTGTPRPIYPVIGVLILILAGRRYYRPAWPAFNFKSVVASPLLLVFLIQLALILITTNAFLALPDVDAYHWIQTYQTKFDLDHLAALPQRPLFHALVYIMSGTLHLPNIFIFKYLIPLIGLTTLMPAWLVARQIPNRLAQAILLLLPTISPSLILHQYMGTPQSILLTLTTFFVFFLLYAHLIKDKFWHYLAGLIMAIAALYHGLALLIFSAWLIGTILHSRSKLLGVIIILLVLAISAPFAAAYLPQITSDIRLNLSFPASFTTIDGVANGWPTLSGLIQYYAFYVGLAIPLVILLFIYLFSTNKQFRRTSITFFTSSAGPTTLLLLLAGFFTISEILPRLFNIALLPERAWLFTSLASLVFLWPLLTDRWRYQRFFITALLVLMFIGLAGAIYVNSLKAYLLPDYSVRAGVWINDNLPGATILTTQSANYIDLYIGQPIRALPRDFYCQYSQSNGSQVQQAISQLHPDLNDQPTYIIYLAIDPNHPYLNRPWWRGPNNDCNRPLLKNFPDQFLPVYNDQDQAIVWQIR